MKTLYKNIKSHIPPFVGDRFRIEHFVLSKKAVEQAKFSALIRGTSGEVHSLEAGTYVKLVDTEKKQIVMSDTPMELETNRTFVQEARGTVLVGGLGLGIVLLAIQSKKEVKRIVVVERERELIEYVGKLLPLNKKVEILHGDINTYETVRKFDTIYFDIWNTICGDNWDEMKKLHRRFRKNLNTDGWLGSWRDDDCKRLKAAERREAKMYRNF